MYLVLLGILGKINGKLCVNKRQQKVSQRYLENRFIRDGVGLKN